MKKKLLLTSILSIVMCFSLIVGATFALFTSESTVNVAVTSGTVKVTASVEKWQYKTLTKDWTDADLDETVLFDNIGGTATITDGATVKLDKIVPGDGVKLSVKIVNEGNVNVKYKVVVKNTATTDAKLFDAMDITVDGAAYTGESESYWMNLAVGATGTSVPVTVELPKDVDGADLMGKTCEFNVTVQAIQGNAQTSNILVNDANSLQNAINAGGNIALGGDINLTSSLTVPAGEEATIDLNGKTISAGSATSTASTFSAKTYAETTSFSAIENKGTLTIINAGEIKNENAYSIINNGTLIINGGKISGLGGIRSTGGKIEVNGGVITCSSNWSTGTYNHMLKAENTEVVINGGTFDATIGGTNNAMIGVSVGAKIEINGGMFKNVNGEIPNFPPYLFSYDDNNGENDGQLIINDGTFYGGWRFNTTATTTINGGMFTVKYDGQSNFTTHTLTITGGTFVYDNLNKCVADGYTAKELDGKYIVIKADGSEAVATDNTNLNTAIAEGATEITLGAGTFIIPDSAKGKNLTIKGSGEDTVIASQDEGGNEGDCDYSFDGSTVTFENVTITTSTTYFPGYARMKGIYNNCTINGVYTLYDDSVFNNCTFNVSGDVYNIWTWGASIATFNNCTFNSDGKAILLYSTVDTKLTVTDCTFNDNGGLADLKAAIEIGNDYGKSYTLTVNNTVVNGYEINDKGINTGSTLWANKNSMGTDKLTVTVDGVEIYGPNAK